MTEIIKIGHVPEPQTLNFRCEKCGTEFRTDEYSIMHAPRQVGQTEPSKERYFHTTCPLCQNYITHMIKF